MQIYLHHLLVHVILKQLLQLDLPLLSVMLLYLLKQEEERGRNKQKRQPAHLEKGGVQPEKDR